MEDGRSVRRGADPAGAPSVEQTAQAALEDPDPVVRERCVRELARVGGASTTRVLMRVATSDPAPSVRLEAVAALGRRAPALRRDDL